MMKERMAALVIGGLMLFSVAGYAIMGIGRFVDNAPRNEIPTVMNKYLSSDELLSILRTGRVVIRSVHSSDCRECASRDASLEVFARGFQGYVVLEKASIDTSNMTDVSDSGYVKFQMVSPTGDIAELEGKEITQNMLTDIFCDITAVQPKECLLRDIAKNQPANNQSSNKTNQTG